MFVPGGLEISLQVCRGQAVVGLGPELSLGLRLRLGSRSGWQTWSRPAAEKDGIDRAFHLGLGRPGFSGCRCWRMEGEVERGVGTALPFMVNPNLNLNLRSTESWSLSTLFT